MLLVLALLLSSATAQLVFNNPEFACGRPKKFLTECSDVAELEKPLFYTCHSGETRDRLIDLQVRKRKKEKIGAGGPQRRAVRWHAMVSTHTPSGRLPRRF